MSRESRRARVSARTSSALAEGRGQRRVPWGVNWAPRLALRLISFINMAGAMAGGGSSSGLWFAAGDLSGGISPQDFTCWAFLERPARFSFSLGALLWVVL